MSRRERARTSAVVSRGAMLAVVALAVLAAAGYDRAAPVRAAGGRPAPVVRDLPFRREVLLPPAAAGAWVVITADTLLSARCAADFADVRLVDAAGGVRPLLALPPRRYDEALVLVTAHVLRWRTRDDGTGECDLDLGDLAGGEFLLRAPDQAGLPWRDWRCSSDRQQWRPLDGLFGRPVPGRPEIELPLLPLDADRPSRYLRLVRPRLPAVDRPETLRVYRRERHEAPLSPVARRGAEATISGGRLVQTFTFPGGAATVAAIRFDRPLGDIHQKLTLEVRADGYGWRSLSLTRDPDPQLLRCEPTRTAALRLSATGVDPAEPPFAVTDVLAVRQRWAFPQPGAGRFWLFYGDRWRTPRAGYAESDFALASLRLPAELGPEDGNPDFAPPGPGLAWLQRHPAVLTAAMLAILGTVVALAVGARPRGA